MALFKKRPRTSQQKAQRAQIGIAARVIGCGYLIYIVVEMFKTAPEEDSMNQNLKYAIAVVFIAAAAVIIVITLLELFRNLKGGFYKADAYSDDVNPALVSSDGDGEVSVAAESVEGEGLAVPDEAHAGRVGDDDDFDDEDDDGDYEDKDDDDDDDDDYEDDEDDNYEDDDDDDEDDDGGNDDAEDFKEELGENDGSDAEDYEEEFGKDGGNDAED